MKRAFIKKQLSCLPFRQAVIVNNVLHSFNGIMTRPIILKRPILILIELSNLNLTLLQNKQLIHEILKELLKEQTKTPRGWNDDVNFRVEELKLKKGDKSARSVRLRWNDQEESVSILSAK